MAKKPKQNAQQAFNQFLFDTMMDKIRAVELYEKEVAGYGKQISQHILDHKENKRVIEAWMSECQKRVEELEKRMVQIDILRDRLNDHDESIESLTETVDQLSTCKCQAGEQMLKRITELEESNATFLKSIPDIEILKTRVIGLVRDVDALQIRLSRAQDMIAEMHKDGFIEIKGTIKPQSRLKTDRKKAQ